MGEDLFADFDGPFVDKQGRRMVTEEEGPEEIWDDVTVNGFKTPPMKARKITRVPVGMKHVRSNVFVMIEGSKATWMLRTEHPENFRRAWNECQIPPIEPPPKNLQIYLLARTQSSLDSLAPAALALSDLAEVGLWLELGERVSIRDYLPYENGCRYFDGVDRLEASGVVYPKRKTFRRVVLSGQSGRDAVPVEREWIEAVKRQCEAAGVEVEVMGEGT